jgi:hypothetical protein
MAQKRDITLTSMPYRTYTDITSDKENLVLGSQNIMTSAQQLMQRIPGFADAVEASITTFTGVKSSMWWALWGGARFLHILCDVSGGVAKVYKFESGVDTSHVLIFTSGVSTPFDFVVSNNTLYMGNGTDMRKYSGTGSTTTKWGIVRPAAPLTVGTTGTGVSAYAGWYYRVTYCNSTTSHESSASDLSPCTGITTNKTNTIALVASADGQVDQIRVYRTTDGGSTDPTLMQEVTGSPFANTTTTVNEATADINLSVRTAPGTTSNDPPTPCSKLIAYGNRVFGAANATVYYSGDEELPANGVPAECWPSGLDGNNQPYPQEVTSLRPLANGVAVFTRHKIWQIQGTQRDNFIFSGLLDRRGAISHTATAALGNSVGWLDTASQVWLDGQEIGFDIRNDIKTIDHSQAYMAIHLQGMQHWLCLLDGANGKLYLYDMDVPQWLPPKVIAAGGASPACSALTSGESASSTISLTVALGKTQMYKMNPTKYNDGGTAYSAVAIVNLLKVGDPDGPFEGVALETDSHTASAVSYLCDEDPTVTGATFTDMTVNSSDPVRRTQGVNLVKKLYKPDTAPMAERVSTKYVWPTTDANLVCYTITVNPSLRPGESK